MTSKTFNYFKFEVKDKYESSRVQEVLFRCGYSWGDYYKPYITGEQVRNTDYRFLYACADGQIRGGYNYIKDRLVFDECEAQLIKADEVW